MISTHTESMTGVTISMIAEIMRKIRVDFLIIVGMITNTEISIIMIGVRIIQGIRTTPHREKVLEIAIEIIQEIDHLGKVNGGVLLIPEEGNTIIIIA